MLVLLLSVTLLVFARSYNAFVYPQLHCEDGAIMFAYYVGQFDPTRVYRFCAGYVSLLPNIVSYLASAFRPALAPYLMSGYALLLSGVVLTVFASRRFRWIVESDGARMAFCLVLALVPVGNGVLMSGATYSMWHLLLLMLLLLWGAPPSTTVARIGQFLFLALAIWSHPFSMALVPVCAIALYFVRGTTGLVENVVLVILCLVYALVGVRPEANTFHIDLALIPGTLNYVLHRVVFESVFGGVLGYRLYGNGLSYAITTISLLMVLLVVVALFKLRRDLTRPQLVAVLSLVALIVGLTLLGIIGRQMDASSHLGRYEQRYFYLQQRLMLLLLALPVFLLLRRSAQYKLKRAWVILALVLFGTFVAAINVGNYALFVASKEQGEKTVQFAREVDAQMSRPASERAAPEMVLPRGGTWDIKVSLTEHVP